MPLSLERLHTAYDRDRAAPMLLRPDAAPACRLQRLRRHLRRRRCLPVGPGHQHVHCTEGQQCLRAAPLGAGCIRRGREPHRGGPGRHTGQALPVQHSAATPAERRDACVRRKSENCITCTGMCGWEQMFGWPLPPGGTPLPVGKNSWCQWEGSGACLHVRTGDTHRAGLRRCPWPITPSRDAS